MGRKKKKRKRKRERERKRERRGVEEYGGGVWWEILTDVVGDSLKILANNQSHCVGSVCVVMGRGGGGWGEGGGRMGGMG